MRTQANFPKSRYFILYSINTSSHNVLFLRHHFLPMNKLYHEAKMYNLPCAIFLNVSASFLTYSRYIVVLIFVCIPIFKTLISSLHAHTQTQIHTHTHTHIYIYTYSYIQLSILVTSKSTCCSSTSSYFTKFQEKNLNLKRDSSSDLQISSLALCRVRIAVQIQIFLLKFM